MSGKLPKSPETFTRICALLALTCAAGPAQITLNLPPSPVTPTVTFSTNQSLPSFVTVQFTNLPTGFDVQNTTYAGWCADFKQQIVVNPAGPDVFSENNALYNLFNTYSTSLPSITGINNANWPLVNWLLNHPAGNSGTVMAGVLDVQEAIWNLLGSSYFNDGSGFEDMFDPAHPSLAARMLVNDANAHGMNFVPGPGQLVAVLLQGVSQPGNSGPPQSLIIPVPVPAAACPVPIQANGATGGYGIVGLPGANIQLSSGPLQVNSNALIGQNGQLALSGGAHLNSTLIADTSAQVSISGGSQFNGGQVNESTSSITSAIQAISIADAKLAPTQTFGPIQNAVNIVGNGGQNVIAVDGDIHLSGGAQFTISGGPSDTFIFNITGGFQLDGGANVILSGLQPNQVLFNFIGTGNQIQTSGKANTAGVFLAPSRTIQINGGTHNSEFISGQTLSFQSNPIVNSACP